MQNKLGPFKRALQWPSSDHISLFCYGYNLWRQDIEHYDILHIDTQNNTLNCDAQTNNTATSIQCLSHFTVIMLSAVKLNVIIPSVVA